MTATDYEEPALEGVRFNAARNSGSMASPRGCSTGGNSPTDLGRFDRVVAADVLYEPHHAAALAGVIAAHALTQQAWLSWPIPAAPGPAGFPTPAVPRAGRGKDAGPPAAWCDRRARRRDLRQSR